MKDEENRCLLVLFYERIMLLFLRTPSCTPDLLQLISKMLHDCMPEEGDVNTSSMKWNLRKGVLIAHGVDSVAPKSVLPP